METRSIAYLISLFLALFITLMSTPAAAAQVASHVLISEIQADSIPGTGGIEDDWVELYNPTDTPIDLAASNYRLEKTQSAANPDIVMRIGDPADGSYPGGTIIPAFGFYLIVRDEASQSLRDMADAIGTRDEFVWSGTDYTLYLGTGSIGSDTDPDIVDKLGFGSSATYYETSPAPDIPEGESLQRKTSQSVNYNGINGPAWDSDENIADFFVQSAPFPQNSSSPEPLPPIPETLTALLFGIGLLITGGYLFIRNKNTPVCQKMLQ